MEPGDAQRVISALDEPFPAGCLEVGQPVHSGVAERVDASGEPASSEERWLAIIDRWWEFTGGRLCFRSGRVRIEPWSEGNWADDQRAVADDGAGTPHGFGLSRQGLCYRGVVEGMHLGIEGVADHVHRVER